MVWATRRADASNSLLSINLREHCPVRCKSPIWLSFTRITISDSGTPDLSRPGDLRPSPHWFTIGMPFVGRITNTKSHTGMIDDGRIGFYHCLRQGKAWVLYLNYGNRNVVNRETCFTGGSEPGYRLYQGLPWKTILWGRTHKLGKGICDKIHTSSRNRCSSKAALYIFKTAIWLLLNDMDDHGCLHGLLA